MYTVYFYLSTHSKSTNYNLCHYSILKVYFGIADSGGRQEEEESGREGEGHGEEGRGGKEEEGEFGTEKWWRWW